MDEYGSACTVHPERCQQYLGRPGEGFLPQWTPALILLVYAIVIAASVHLPFWANKSSSPQYLSSSGLPIELTRTGMVNVFLVMLIAINMPFFLAMLSSTPCETALGGCNSISCVCANYLLPFGYVFMFVCILYGSLLLVRMLREMRPRSWKEMVEDGCWGCFMSAVKVILALACFGPTLTAIFPALETTYVTDPYAKEHYWGNTLHGVGVTVFPLVLILITFVWYVGHHAHKARGSAPVPFPKRGAFARLAFILLTAVVGVSFGVAAVKKLGALGDDHTNYCNQAVTKDSCKNWLEHPVGLHRPELAAFSGFGGSLPVVPAHKTINDPTKPPYTCQWAEPSPVNFTAAQLLYTTDAWLVEHGSKGRCIKKECELVGKSWAIALEFCLLWLMFMYSFSFAAPDAVVLSGGCRLAASRKLPQAALSPAADKSAGAERV